MNTELKTVTIWSKLSKKTNAYEHNHLEDGRAQTDVPQPGLKADGKPYEAQKGWANEKWLREHLFLNQLGKIIPG